MSIDLQVRNPNLLFVRLSDELTREDYERIVPEIDSELEKRRPLRLLVEMRDFIGCSASAQWEESELESRFLHKIDRIAMVGESDWKSAMDLFRKTFTRAKVRFFSRQEADVAEDWIEVA